MNSSSFLLKCFAEGNQDAVLKSVNCLNEKQLCNLIDGHHPQTCELMQVILKALITDKNEGFQKHDFVVKHCVSLINEGQMPQKVLAGMVSYLLVQINSASCSLLLDLCNIFLEAIESGICRNEKSLELFAKVLSAISLKESVFHKKDICTPMSGPQYKAYILNKLCSSRGIDMSEEELRVVVEKMILTLPSIDILELPPLVYQLLLMSNQGFKRTILAGIISYMTSLNLQIRKEQEASNEIVAISDKQLQPLEGTVILHMTYAIKQDQDLGKELIKYFKENSNTSSSFRLALSLAVARISRFHDLIFDILKSSIIKAYKDNERFNSCRWLRDSSRTPLTIEKATLKVIENRSIEARKIAAFGMTVLLKAYKEMEREGNLNLSSQVAVLYSQESNLVHIHSQTGSKLNHKWVKSEILRFLSDCFYRYRATKTRLQYSDEAINDLPASNLISSLNSVVTRMIKCEIEDFQLDKEADFSPVTAAGCRNLILCKLIANLYEVLIEFMLRKNDFAIGDCEDATRLFERYSRITQILRENGNNPHVRSVKSKYRLETMISFSCVSTLIRIIFGNVSPCYQESQRILSQSISFVKFTFIALQDRLNEVGSCSADHMEIFQYCQTVGRTIFKSIIGETVHETFLTTDDGIMNKSISLLQLETFGSLINTIFKSFSDRIEPFLRNLSILDEQINNQDEMIYALVAFFQKLINSALTAGAEFKQAHIAMTIILSLLQHLGESGLKQVRFMSDYDFKLINKFYDLQLVKCFIDQLFTICNRIEDILGLLLTVSIDIHGQLGDVEEDIEVKKHNNFAIITEFTAAPTVLVILSSQLEAAMENIDWLVSNLNALIFDDDIGEAEFSRTYSEMEATVCSRLTMVAQCLQEIIESAIPTKTCTECSVKGVTRLYTSMTFLVKHYMQLFMRRRVTVSERFENLVKLSGLQVTPKANRAIIEDTDDNRIRKKRKGKSNSSSTTRGNAVRESRVIPNLIYAIEMYEAHLIRLEAKLQVNLMQYFKRSTSRDFKIHGATLQTIIDDDSDDSYEVPMEVSEKNRPRKKLK
ncbi:Fanconi anemia group I protein [Trichoplax sp. H2]|nr:Fanconi anemia group I protein [Trichoplax sp. H2]|eukprot:RDD38597.1 Fanconi anemia group I protein [Trichoplax sp. H2]